MRKTLLEMAGGVYMAGLEIRKGKGMKLYEFKTIVWAVVFTISYLMLFVFGFIWLEKGFDVKELLQESEMRTLQRLEERLDSKVNKDAIMPSAFKGRQ